MTNNNSNDNKKVVRPPNTGEDVEKLDHSYVVGENKMVQTFWKIVWSFLKN